MMLPAAGRTRVRRSVREQGAGRQRAIRHASRKRCQRYNGIGVPWAMVLLHALALIAAGMIGLAKALFVW